MMKNMGFVAAIFFFIICAVASNAEEAIATRWRFPDHSAAFPALPSGLKKCFTALRDEGRTCIHEIFFSFWAHRVLVGSDCCQAMQEAKEDCSAALFEHFNNKLFCQKLENYCAHKVSGTPAKNPVFGSAPSSAPPSSEPAPSSPAPALSLEPPSSEPAPSSPATAPSSETPSSKPAPSVSEPAPSVSEPAPSNEPPSSEPAPSSSAPAPSPQA